MLLLLQKSFRLSKQHAESMTYLGLLIMITNSTELSSEPVESTSHSQTQFIQDLLEYYPLLTSGLFPSSFLLKLYINFSSSPCVLYVHLCHHDFITLIIFGEE
jgi:hypothetical protein